MTELIVRPEFAANCVPCVVCGAPDAYAPSRCEGRGQGHVSQYDLVAGR